MSTEAIHDPRYPFGRKWAFDQALASARIEGYVPDEESLADFHAVRNGTMTGDEFRTRAIARAHKMEAAINLAKAPKCD